MADTATLQARLDALEKAEFELVAGKRGVRVSYGGESVEYQPTDLQQLRDMIGRIKRELGLPGGTRPAARSFRRARP